MPDTAACLVAWSSTTTSPTVAMARDQPRVLI
jgi:hypothetical protein